MRIDDANITLAANHAYHHESTVEVTALNGFQSIYDSLAATAANNTAESPDVKGEEALVLLLKRLITRLLDVLSGKAARAHEVAGGVPALGIQDGQAAEAHTVKVTRSISTRVEQHESETTTFAATGQVVTGDGRCLNLSLGLCMARDYRAVSESTQTEQFVLRDPLIVNFAGNAADLSGRCMAFDLEGDGVCEAVDGLGAGSGYLAIDVNHDGRINDGRELFGTRSGDGFADLAQYDTDANHWIDENDAAYRSLLIWRPNADGREALRSLAEAGVGAIYLGHTETPFSLTTAENQLRGVVRSSGVYLQENGTPGSIQQVDLAV